MNIPDQGQKDRDQAQALERMERMTDIAKLSPEFAAIAKVWECLATLPRLKAGHLGGEPIPAESGDTDEPEGRLFAVLSHTILKMIAEQLESSCINLAADRGNERLNVNDTVVILVEAAFELVKKIGAPTPALDAFDALPEFKDLECALEPWGGQETVAQMMAEDGIVTEAAVDVLGKVRRAIEVPEAECIVEWAAKLREKYILEQAIDGETLARQAETIREMRGALENLKRAVEKGGDWDEGCFYFKGTSASELQAPLNAAGNILDYGGIPDPNEGGEGDG